MELRKDAEPFVFYEGPPSANGMPGIHHVLARTIKDLFCRYQTLKGKRVERKAGWDTHMAFHRTGCREGVGHHQGRHWKEHQHRTVQRYCRKAVIKYPITGRNSPSAWATGSKWTTPTSPTRPNTLKRSGGSSSAVDKDMIYKGYTIRPIHQGRNRLSSHELNQPGYYRDVKDTTVVARFGRSISCSGKTVWFGPFNYGMDTTLDLPANTALAVGEDIEYVYVSHPMRIPISPFAWYWPSRWWPNTSKGR